MYSVELDSDLPLSWRYMLPDMESRYLQVNVFEGQRDVRGESSE